MEQKKVKNRWLMLFCICCNTFCLGGLYAWSAFSGELANYMGWDYSKVTVAYSVMTMTIAAMGLVGGMLLQKFGPKKLIRLSGIMWGLGWLLTGFSQNLLMLYFVFGLLAGSASGFGYTPGVVTAVSWFPDKKGFASGMAVGICGLASLIVAPLANFLLTQFNVMTAFKIIGGIFLVLSLGTSWYIDSPPAGWKPEGYEPPANAVATSGKTWREILRDPRCYVLWATLLFASVAGLTLIGHASKIGQEVAGISAAQAAMLVGIMAVGNFGGRLILGSLSDVVGRHRIVMAVMVICALDMVFLARTASFFSFVIAIVIAGACFGGVLATFSAMTSDTFGPKYNGINYSIIFTGYGLASVVGPNMATTIRASSGSYSGAFIFAAACSLLAAVLCFIAKKLNQKVA